MRRLAAGQYRNGYKPGFTPEDVAWIETELYNEAARRHDAGIPFRASDRFYMLNQLVMAAHFGVSPRQMAMGVYDETHGVTNAGISLSNGGLNISYDIVKNDAGTGKTPPTGGVAPIYNPLATPSFGASTGLVPVTWLDDMIREASRITMATKFARTFPMVGPVDQAPIKKVKAEDWMGSVTPVKEGRAGVDVEGGYALWNFDAYEYLYHSAISLRLLDAVGNRLPIREDLVADMAELYQLMVDQDYFESQWAGIIFGKIRRWTGSAFANNADVAQGAAPFIGANAPKHIVFYNLKDKKLYTPSTTAADVLKFQSSTLHTEAPSNLEFWDVFPVVGEMLKQKRAKFEYFAANFKMTKRLAWDSRFSNVQYKTGSIVNQGETGFLGSVPVGGTSTFVDAWELPQGILDAKMTTDTTPVPILPVLCGQYQRSGAVCPWKPFQMGVDKGFEVVARTAADGTANVSVVRPNNTEVLTAGAAQAVIPWDLQGLALVLVVDVVKA